MRADALGEENDENDVEGDEEEEIGEAADEVGEVAGDDERDGEVEVEADEKAEFTPEPAAMDAVEE